MLGSGKGLLVMLVLLAPGSGVAADGPAPAADQSDQEVQRLIQQLGDRDYFARQRAETQLSRLGVDAFDALSEATTNDDLEIAARAKRILHTMRVDWADRAAPPEVKQLLRDYEYQNAQSRQAKMHALAVMPGDVGIAALCRLVRFEKTALLSKLAAIEVIQSQKPGVTPKKETADVVLKGLDGSRRVAAVWLRTWLRFCEDSAVNAEWNKLIDAEEALLRNAVTQSSPEVVAALLRFQVERLKRFGRPDEAIGAIRRLIQLEKGDPEALAGLLQWLIEQKAWKAVEELAERFAPQIAVNPGLLYRMAEAQLAQDRKAEAEQTAERALGLNPGGQRQDLISHYLMASGLRQRGQFAWAKREYQHIVADGQGDSDLALSSYLALSEMLHDQGHDLDAAESLAKAIDSVGPNRPGNTNVLRRSLGELRSRMDYFYACHWQQKGNTRKQREYLDKGLADDPADIEVLIACYRLTDAEPEYRQKIRGLIEKTAAELREKIADEPDEVANYNQYAWLVGNTEGDYDEALKCSQKSLELSPETGGYFDTLARCYFAKGDLENAVKYQGKAVELDPHSGQVRKQLEVFRKKLEEKQPR